MSTRDAAFIVKTIRKGNDQASIALLKTFGIVRLQKMSFPKIKKPSYYWLKPEHFKE